MKLALFDLDHTLIPFDSGMAWTRHLVRQGALHADAQERYLGYCRQYLAGTLDIHAMHHASMAPLAAFSAAQLQRWQAEFEAAVRPVLPPTMQALVATHRDRGDLCAIVTATCRLVAEPFARGFRVEHLLATESQQRDGVPTGAIDGLPCYREHKLTQVQAWLAARPTGPRELAGFDESWFYSDSASDLPLLRAVTHPVAVRPEPHLRAHARAAGWRVCDDGAARGLPGYSASSADGDVTPA
jgi:HAD superfamily hydrolase (TIGR01490 family)